MAADGGWRMADGIGQREAKPAEDSYFSADFRLKIFLYYS